MHLRQGAAAQDSVGAAAPAPGVGPCDGRGAGAALSGEDIGRSARKCEAPLTARRRAPGLDAIGAGR